VTVSAPSCVEAGMVATMALLQGAGAAAWLRQTGVPHALIDEQGVLQAHFDYPQREDASWPQG
jgi:hypothetical protein